MIVSFCDVEQGEEVNGEWNAHSFNDSDHVVTFYKEKFKEKYGLTSRNGEIESFILVILSQPDEKEIHALYACAWDKVLVRRGIRAKGETFSTIEELKRLVFRAQQEKLREVKENYLLHFRNYSPLELRELAQMSAGTGIFMNDGTMETNHGKEDQSFFHSSNLTIAYMGDESAFKTFVHGFKCCPRRVLVIDADLLKPSFDIIFSVSPMVHEKGLYQLMMEQGNKTNGRTDIEKNVVKLYKKVDLLLGNYDVEKYGHFTAYPFRNIMTELAFNYDICIYKISDSMYDRFGMQCAKQANYTVLCWGRDQSILRYYRQLYHTLIYKQGISRKKILVFKNKGMGMDPFMHAYFGSSYKGILSSSVVPGGR